MISLRLEEVKSFMAKLLTNTLFDEFVLKEMEIQTFTTFHISGQFHEKFFSDEELNERDNCKVILWRDIRSIALSIIRGMNTPLLTKIVFQLPEKQAVALVESLGTNLKSEDVGGLYINVRFENKELHMITGTAIKTFTLDKTLEQEWDAWVKRFLADEGIIFEEE